MRNAFHMPHSPFPLRILSVEYLHSELGRDGIEPSTLGLLTTLAFTSIHVWICSLDYIINLAVVRRVVSEEPLRFDKLKPKGFLRIAQSWRLLLTDQYSRL